MYQQYRRYALALRSLAMCLGLSHAAACTAGLLVEGMTPRDETGPRVFTAMPVLTFVGTTPGDPDVIETSGHGVSLTTAIRSVLPNGWSGWSSETAVKAELARLTSISYAGRQRPWPEVLEELLASAGLAATVDWTNKQVTLRLGTTLVR